MMISQNHKKILILSLAYYPELVAGLEVAIKEITDRFAENEAVFDMVTLRLNSRLPRFEKIGNVNVYRVGFTKNNPSAEDLVTFPLYLNKVLYPLLATWKFWQLDRKNHYDGIWAMMSYMGMTAVLIRAFVRKISFVLTLQEGDSFEHILERKRIKLFLPLIKKGFRDATTVQVISNYLANWAREMGAKNVVVVSNGVDVKKFKNQKSKIKNEEIRRKLGFEENDVILVTTSRLVEKNAVGDIIEALQYLPENVKLIIIGIGELESNLKLKTKNLQLESRVRFIGFLSHTEIPQYLWASDIFIRPSLSEGMGNSFIEAMAAGLPVIATPVGGIVDFLKDGETGLFCEVGNPKSIAQKVEKLLKDAESRDYIVRTAGKMVAEKYDWSMIADRMEKVLESL